MKLELCVFILILGIIKKFNVIDIGVDYVHLLIMFIMIVIATTNFETHIEGLTNNEALQNIAGIYNSDTMVVKNLKVTGTATLGNWNIRDNKIGITGVADMQLANDKFVRLIDYDGTKSVANGGFAGDRLWADTSLNLNSTLITQNGMKHLTYRKNNIAGYFAIKAYGQKIPIYYGINMMWKNHIQSININNNTVKNQGYVTFTGDDFRAASNPDWTPRYLMVFPGYVARLIYWDVPYDPIDICKEGEYNWGDKRPRTSEQAVHIIQVWLAEETNTDTRTAAALCA